MITAFYHCVGPIKKVSIGLFLGGCVALTSNSMAATVQGGSEGITVIDLPADYTTVQLSGEDGTQLSSKNGIFETGEGFVDGYYTYKILSEVAVEQPLVEQQLRAREAKLNNGRDPNVKPASVYLKTIESKRFLIMDGLVVNPDLAEE